MDAPPVQYAHTSDGYDIAYADVGHGCPLVFMPQATTHIHVFWTQSTFVQPWFHGLSQQFRLILYDGRGQGMSTRNLAPGLSTQNMADDLETLIERLRLDEFVLMAIHWSGHAAIRYAAAHPERLRALVLTSTPCDFRAWPLAMLLPFSQSDWDGFLRSIAGLAKAPEIAASVERLKQTTTQADWNILMQAALASDIAPILPRIKTPALVLHPRESLNLPPEESMKLAAAIPNARFTLIDGATPLGDAGQGIAAIGSFLAGLEVRRAAESKSLIATGSPSNLSHREAEVLRLLAVGKSNQEIAETLVISSNTVRRHVSNIFDKTGVANRAQAGAWARDHDLA